MDFIGLKTQQKIISTRLKQRINKVLEHGQYINGPEVGELEETLAKFVGSCFTIGVGSGTDALIISLLAHGVKPGDAIFCPSFSFIATAEVITLLGATPVFVDIDEDTFNISPQYLETTIVKIKNEKRVMPRGIITVDIFGQPAEYGLINKIAAEFGLFVIEDGAQSFGSSMNGRKSCSLAGIGITSFFPTKPLGCYGDGGMIFTDDNLLYDKMSSIKEHGIGSVPYSHVQQGINGRLDSIQAAVLLEKMTIFEDELVRRQNLAQYYDDSLSGLVKTPFIKLGNFSVYAQYSVLSSLRKEIMLRLQEAGIPSRIYYPIPLHLQEVFAKFGYKEGDLPVTEIVSNQIFSLPFHPYLENEDIDRIVEVIKSV